MLKDEEHMNRQYVDKVREDNSGIFKNKLSDLAQTTYNFSLSSLGSVIYMQGRLRNSKLCTPSKLEELKIPNSFLQRDLTQTHHLNRSMKEETGILDHIEKEKKNSSEKMHCNSTEQGFRIPKSYHLRQNINTIWRNRRVLVTKERKNQTQASTKRKSSIFLEHQNKFISSTDQIELKLHVKKVQSQVRKEDKNKNQKRAVNQKNRKLQKVQLPQFSSKQKNVNENKRRKNSLQKIRYKPEFLPKQSLKKKSVKHCPQQPQPLKHIRNIINSISQNSKVDEQKIKIVVSKQNILYLNDNSGVDNLCEFSSNCLEVSYYNEEKSMLKGVFSRQENKRVEIASITKIMTCFLGIKIAEYFNINLHKEKVLVSERAYRTIGTIANLEYSDILTLNELLHALMLPSGNDAAIAVGEWGGKIIRKYCEVAKKYISVKNIDTNKSLNFVVELMAQKKSYLKLFIYHMNKTAKALGLNDTFFANTHGLTNSLAYSTARDINILTALAMKCKVFRKIVGTKSFSCKVFNRTFSQVRRMEWFNTHKLLEHEGFIGVKTGITPAAGPCLTSMFEWKKGQYMIVTLLKVKSMNDRFRQSLELIRMGLNKVLPDRISQIRNKMKYELDLGKQDKQEANLMIEVQKDEQEDEQEDHEDEDFLF